MKKLPAITAAIVFGLGGICNETHTQSLAQKATIEHEQNKMQSALRYLYDVKEELAAINLQNNTKKLSLQNTFFLMYYNQKITELEVLLNKYKAIQKDLSSEESLSATCFMMIQMKINEIELLKAQAHENTNNTNIIGL